jgi:hypothetical protein
LRGEPGIHNRRWDNAESIGVMDSGLAGGARAPE